MKKTDTSIVILFLLLAALSNNIYSQNAGITYKRLYVDRDTEIKDGTAVTETIRVRKGATLTVNCKLSMGQNAKLIVEPGGKLHINGGTLTNAEEGKTWYGIEVWGDPAAGQNPIDQGWVLIQNGATIENSVHGIVASHLEEDSTSGPGELTPNPAYAGGIVQAIGSGFINNQSTVWFYAYPQSSASWFTDCDFEINDGYFGSEDPGYFVRMDGMKGIDFTICRFNNNTSGNCFGSGIYSFNSGFNVKGKSTGLPAPFDWEHSKFNNLRYAVYATSGGTLNIPDISHSQFTGNYRGVYFSGVRNSIVEYCDFVTGPACAGASYGIYLDRSTAYTIEDNTFSQGDGNGIGLVVNNSGGDPNRIYRNSFTGLKFGILAQQENRAADGNGLVLKCNTYNENGHDQLVLWDGLFISKKAGIAEGQGADIPQPYGPAGNLFSWTGPEGTATDIYNEANNITYYYHIDDDYPLRPKYVSVGKVIPEPNNHPEAYWDPEESCPPSESGGGTGDTEGLKSLVATSAQKADSVQNIITILKDGGSTDNLKTEVALSTPPEAFSIYAELMGSSPYISDTVMAAAIEKEEVIPNVMIRDVMVANPHNAKNNELLEKIDERSNPMPDYMKAQIVQGGGLVSLFEDLQSQKAFYVQQHVLALNALERSYLADTLAPVASIDSLRALLQNENKLAAKQSLVFLDMGRGAWGEVQNTLEAIPQSFNLTEEEEEEHAQLLTFTGIVANLAQEGKGIMEADSAQITALFGIEASRTGIAAVFARNALLALDEISYDEPVLMPDFLKSSTIADEHAKLMKALEEHHYLRVFPNPASDYLVIAHELEALQQSPYAEIYGLKGGKRMHVKLSGLHNQETIDIKGLKPGVYIVSLFADNKELESVKFTKVK